MAITAEMQKQLAGLARAANRRIERASEGQRRALNYYMRSYHTRERANGVLVFRQGKAKTEAEYKARMRELELFMGTDEKPTISKRAEWKRVKQEQLEAFGDYLRDEEESNLTDDELAIILEEAGKDETGAYKYEILHNVEIAKDEQGSAWRPTKEAIKDAMYQRRSAQERVTALIKSRNKRSKKA